ncbi:MAG: hypothetical protein DDT20_00421 [Firmicutes bacterium]|nr:hypothetical protein [Bacillota bacterium]
MVLIGQEGMTQMAVFGIVAAFVAIVLLVQRKVQVGLALIVGAVIVGLSSGQGVFALLGTAVKSLGSTNSVNLILTLGLISLLGAVMQEGQVLSKMVSLLQVALRSTKLTIMLVPSLIGTLLVTGGAIMSAPTVEKLGQELELPPARMAAINLLFRHGWYFVYPLIPGFILITSLTGLPLSRLLLWQLPLTIVSLAAGYFVYLRGIPDRTPNCPPPTRRDFLLLLQYTSPIWVSLALTVAAGLSFPVALLGGLVLALLFGDTQAKDWPQMLYRGLNTPIIAAGVGIVIFQGVIGQVEALPILISRLLATGLPVSVLYVVLPFCAGLVSASNTSALGLTLPLLLPAMQATDTMLFGTVVAYTSSFIGYFASPLHLCQVATTTHFRCQVVPLYREYRWPAAAVITTLIVLGTVM